MIPGSSEIEVQGQKTLAAIVFTDVAGFAHHANTNERRALENLQRDMEIMRDVCARTSGTVLKTMGDGMLMRFPSANQALQCALEIQRVFHEQTKRLLPADILWHRIGVHLGDVVVTSDDVYGDGVNVAARLQKEAKPGSIYLSRTVYDVVKGKMDFPAHYVGPRHLKGISEPVAVWEVPSLGRLELEKRQEALMAMNLPSSPETTAGLRGGRAAAVVAASFVLLSVAVAMVVISARVASREKLIAAAPGKGLKVKSPQGDLTQQTPGTNQEVAKPPEPPKYDSPLEDPTLFQSLKTAFSRYDFASMSGAVVASRYADTEMGKQLVDRYRKLNDFMGWFNAMIDDGCADADHHLTVTWDPGQGNAPAFIWRSGIGELAFKTNSGSWVKPVNELSVEEIGVIASALRELPGSNERLTPAQIDEDRRWLEEDGFRFRGSNRAASP